MNILHIYIGLVIIKNFLRDLFIDKKKKKSVAKKITSQTKNEFLPFMRFENG